MGATVVVEGATVVVGATLVVVDVVARAEAVVVSRGKFSSFPLCTLLFPPTNTEEKVKTTLTFPLSKFPPIPIILLSPPIKSFMFRLPAGFARTSCRRVAGMAMMPLSLIIMPTAKSNETDSKLRSTSNWTPRNEVLRGNPNRGNPSKTISRDIKRVDPNGSVVKSDALKPAMRPVAFLSFNTRTNVGRRYRECVEGLAD